MGNGTCSTPTFCIIFSLNTHYVICCDFFVVYKSYGSTVSMNGCKGEMMSRHNRQTLDQHRTWSKLVEIDLALLYDTLNQLHTDLR